jgi:hypothetical protein
MIPALSFGHNKPIQGKKPLTFGISEPPRDGSSTVTLETHQVMPRAVAVQLWESIRNLWWSDIEAEQRGKKAILELWEYSKAVKAGEMLPEFSEGSRQLLRRATLLESDTPSIDIQKFILACISMVKQPGYDGYEGIEAPALTGPFI